MSSETASPGAEHVETRAPRGPTKRAGWRRWLLPLGLLCAAISLQALARRAPHSIEHYYSRTVFPRIGHGLSLVNGLVGFSIAELILFSLFSVLVGVLVYQALEISQRRKRATQVISAGLLAALWVVGSGLLLFLLLWGLNYHRERLGHSLGLAGRKASDEQLEIISRAIITEINSNYETSRGGPGGAPPDRAQLYELVESAYQHPPLLAGLCSGYARPKPAHLSGVMSSLGISGFYMPFTGEANFNPAQPAFDLPYVIAHEKAHQCGVAREDEANFIAFLVCANSTNAYVRYSGYLNAMNVVYTLASAPDRYERVAPMLGAGPRADLRARADFWARYYGRATELSHQINNSYLQANQVESGTRSYSEDVALIIGYYLTRARGVNH